MPRLRLRPDHAPISLYQPAGGNESLPVEPGQTVDVSGQFITSRHAAKQGQPAPEPLPDDAYVFDIGGEERAWPKSTWELVEDKAAVSREGVIT